jgi:hypothetical protein
MMNLDTTAPMELLESLYYIEQLSYDDYFEELLQIALAQDVKIPSKTDPTVYYLVLLLYL